MYLNINSRDTYTTWPHAIPPPSTIHINYQPFYQTDIIYCIIIIIPTKKVDTPAQPIVFSPAIPFPRPFDVEGHIKVLRDSLVPQHPLHLPKHRANILALIKLYEEGNLDGTQEAWLVDGKIITEEEAYNRPWVWHEVCLFSSPPPLTGPYFYGNLSNK
jgi:hypothetical protein